MNDPYKTLGVDPSASDEEVKKAYRDLARKYHPDRFADDSAKELAEEKMKEINEAYDTVQKVRQSGAAGGYAAYGSGFGGGSTTGGVYGRIRQYIQMGNIAQAEQLLNSVPDRNAEWYFLYGAICQRKGWFDEAQRNFETACNMDPSNAEYRQARTMMQNGGGMYRGGMANGGMDTCGCCSSLLCADCCCECMGGDLIPCC